MKDTVMMRTKLLICGAGWLLCAGSAWGTIINNPWPANGTGSEKNLYQILGTSTGYQEQVPSDSYFDFGSALTSMIVEYAGFSPNNQLGIYSGNSEAIVFAGSAGAGASTAIMLDKVNNKIKIGAGSWQNFFFQSDKKVGFFLQNTVNGNFKYYSDAAKNVTDPGQDHMVTFNGTSTTLIPRPTWVIAWEDLPLASSDKDYNDMVVGLTVVVPEPSTYIAGGLLLIPLLGRLRRLKCSR